MSIPDNVSIVTFLLDLLTWKRLFRFFLLLVFLFLLVLMSMSMSINIFHRPTPLEREDENVRLLTISSNAKSKLVTTIKRIPEIIGIQVVTLNFRKNIRIDTYGDIDVPAVREVYEKWIANKLFETPIFTADKINNQRMLHLINGEFMCVPFRESIAYRYVPQLDQVFVTDVCAIGVPPYSGDSSGILTFYLSMPPSEEQKRTLFLIARDISLTIADDNR